MLLKEFAMCSKLKACWKSEDTAEIKKTVEKEYDPTFKQVESGEFNMLTR